ncbi:uncharacterized protein LOC116295048 [Actinia tenebrosa]|uniref:Uncharacterized protein LOC116295048 n=1 Tax=Actinia tenebrosa TaxID=6105 RepID=A0A6P8HTQ6_ACTTE|nr:uncharacterized protein LOC116295048 [Actinia tenebrosa]
MSSLKIVVFPGPEGVAYTTEKRAVQTNPMIDFLSQHSSTRTQEQIHTIKQITNNHLEAADKRKNTKLKGRQLVCPPILDLAMNKCHPNCEQHPAHKHRRIINGFFPSKIRTSSNTGNVKDPRQEKQEPFEENLTADSPLEPHQNGSFLSRSGSKHGQLSEQPTARRFNDQHEEKVHSGRRVTLSLRNGSPSPWINRYQIKKKSISACNKGNTNSQFVTRGYSR